MVVNLKINPLQSEKSAKRGGINDRKEDTKCTSGSSENSSTYFWPKGAEGIQIR